MSDKITLDLSSTAPPIHSQLGLEAERLEPLRVQEQCDAITLLESCGLLTLREGDRARHRLAERIKPIIDRGDAHYPPNP